MRVPGVDLHGLAPSEIDPTGRLSVVALGITPFLTSFLILELLSFITMWGRRLREGGVEGRRRLNGLAVRLGGAVAVLQAAGVLLFLETLTLPGGAPAVLHPGLGLRILVTSTLAAGSAIAFLVAQLATAYGLGNGFCLLLVYGSVQSLFEPLVGSPAWAGAGGLRQMTALAIAAAAALTVGWCFARRPEIRLGGGEGGGETFALPAFQQGVVPLVWALALVSFVHQVLAMPTALDPLVGTILTVVLGIVAFHAFGGRARLATNLPPGAPLPGEDFGGGRALAWTTALLALFAFATLAGGSWSGFGYLPALGSGAIIVVIAVGFDLVGEWRFRSRFGDSVAGLVELDNVHLASYLHGRLRAHGIDALVRSYHYRSLFFFFRPLVKMELLVPAAELERAREVVAPESLAIV